MRTKNSIKNIIVTLIGHIVSLVISFVARLVFVRMLSAEYLGINGLFTDILSILSLAELGLGSAIIYGLYKPLAVKDEKKIKAWMNFYALVYRIVGIVVLVLGISLMPFLDIIIKEQPNISNLNLIYLLFLTNSVSTYFFAYKRSLIMADQKNYIVTFYQKFFTILVNVVQMIALFLTKNFILYLVIKIIVSLLENLVIARRADMMYPFLKEKNKEKLTVEDKKGLYKNVQAMVYHRVGGVMVEGTDNILVSSFVGIIWVGLYSNYSLIVNAIFGIISQVFESVTASVGNMNAIESKEKSFDIYKVMLLLNFWFFGFSTIALWILLNPFIMLWLGEDYLMSTIIESMIVINFYIKGMRRITLIFRDSFGLFWNDRYKPLVEVIINLLVSAILAQYFGIIGVLFGTFISTMTTSFWIEPYVVYKYGFQRNVGDYFKRNAIFFATLLIAAIPTWYVSSILFTTINIWTFIGKVTVCIVIPNLIFILIFKNTAEFKYVMGIKKIMFEKNK